MRGGTAFADWSLRRDEHVPVAPRSRRRVAVHVVAVGLWAVAAIILGNVLGDALGSRGHPLAEGVRNLAFLGWALPTPVMDGERVTRRTQLVVIAVAVPLCATVPFLF